MPDENEKRKRKEGHNVMWLRLMVTQKGGGRGGCDPRVDTRGIHKTRRAHNR